MVLLGSGRVDGSHSVRLRCCAVKRIVTLGVAAALLLGVGGCANGSQSCKEAREGSAEGEQCSVIRWHESHEGPTVYNNFHSTQ